MTISVLPCIITKPIRRRLLVDQGTVERIFQLVLDLHDDNIRGGDELDKALLERHPPVLTISYNDGTKYECQDMATLRKIVPGKGKSVKSIDFINRFGNLTCSIEVSSTKYSNAADIRVGGLEDKASHFTELVMSEFLRETDITIIARQIWPSVWSFLISSSVAFPLFWDHIKNFQDFYGVCMAVAIMTMFLLFPLDFVRNRWLPPVAFLWGGDGRRAAQAKVVSAAMFFTLPTWILGNAAAKILFG